MFKKPAENFFWSFEISKLAEAFETDALVGLSSETAQKRLAHFGKNIFGQAKKFSKLKILTDQFKSPLIFILIAACLATIFLKEWFDAFIIFLAISVNAGLGFYQENKAETALEDLKSYIKERTRVIRDGVEIEIDAPEIVIGDLITLSSGDRVPADARLVFENGLTVDEAILTGESMPVQKDTSVLSEATMVSERRNMVYGGTLVTEGKGSAIVTATANDTEIGKIADLVIDTKQEKTPLQKAVFRLAWIITFFLTGIVAGVFVLGIYRGETIFDMFLMSVAVAVGAIPEALPIGLTAVLAVGVQKLARKKGIMRNLSAAETLGSTSVIMTDKTGTLTEAKMSLVDILKKEDLILADFFLKRRDNKNLENNLFSEEQKEILLLASMNTDVLVENQNDKPEDWIVKGNALESNIIKSAAINGVSVDQYKENSKFKIILPFNSKNKFSVSFGDLSLKTGVAHKKHGKSFVVLGAPDIILKKAKMPKADYLNILKTIDALSLEGKRILGVATKSVTAGTEFDDSDLENFDTEQISELNFVGLLAFYDPIRKTVPEAIEKMVNYGVRVVMATGDLKGTASAVANQIGFDVKPNEVLSGDEIKQMTDEELSLALPMIKVFARVTPEDKLRIGKLYQKSGEVVAMTGDGVNDAPSLKAADIGIAVGSGTDVAKGVADLVLLDNNFETIVSAIEEGKLMLKNIRKIFVYLMSNSLDEVIMIGGSLILGLALPLTAVQIIWVNFFTGSLPAIAFAFDTEKNLLIKNINKKTEKSVFNKQVKFLTLSIGILNATILFSIYWFLMNKTNFDHLVVRTFIFVCFSSYILFVAFSLRNLSRPIFTYNIFSNKFLVYGVLVGLLLLFVTVYVPFLHNIFGTTYLGFGWIALSTLWIFATIVVVEFAKWIFYRKVQ